MKDVTAALILNGNSVFLARRQIGQHLESMWEFPGGKVDPGETAVECLARELQEEFGVKAEVGDFFKESIYHYDKGAIRLLSYFVHNVQGEFVPVVHDNISWAPLTDLLSYDLAPADVPIAEALVDHFRTRGAICSR